MADQELVGSEESAALSTSPAPVVAVATPAAEPPTPAPPSFRAYDHGFTNGLLRIEAPDFEVFAEESERLHLLERQLHSVAADLQDVRQQRASVGPERLRLTQGRLEAEARSETTRVKLQRALEKLRENASARQAVHEEKQGLKPPYSWPPAVLYLLAGLTFVVADVAVMHDIASNGLDMGGLECWLFSIGLAYVAFLLKPAVDRILEKPYADGTKVRRNHIALLSFAALALVTLGVLGYFRGEATSLANQKTELSSQITAAQTQKDTQFNAGAPTAELDTKIAQLQKGYAEAENARAGSWSMRVGLVLAAILFAIAGAVCLGIAFPALNLLHRSQFVLRNRLRRLTKRIPPLEERVHTLETEVATQQQLQQTYQFTFAELPEVNGLDARLTTLLAQQNALLEQQFRCRTARHQSIYRDGKARGLTYELQGNLSYSVSDADRRVAEAIEAESAHSSAQLPAEGSGDASSLRNPGKRPYVVLRRLISQHYTRHRQNGQLESIEIE